MVFVQFLVEILTSRFEIATYVTNRLNLYYMNQIFAAIIRLATILIGFQVFSVNIVFLVLGSLIGKFFVAGRNMYFTKKFLPELKVKCKYFELKSSGGSFRTGTEQPVPPADSEWSDCILAEIVG